MSDTEFFRDKKVLITGGLGFIGSNLAIRLVEQGARVTLVDAMIDGHGGNLFNIEVIRDLSEVKSHAPRLPFCGRIAFCPCFFRSSYIRGCVV